MFYETSELFKWLVTVLASAFSGLALWTGATQVKRIDTLEEENKQILKDKLSKDDYVKDLAEIHADIRTMQNQFNSDIRDIRDKLAALPHQIVLLLKDSGKI